MKKQILLLIALMGTALTMQAANGTSMNGTDESGLIYSGLYTATGMSYNYNTGQYSNSGVSSLYQVEIYRDRLIVNGKSYAQWHTDGQWLWYGVNNNSSSHPEYLYNTATGELRWRFIFNFFGLQISDNFWFRGNQMVGNTGTGGGYGGTGTTQSGSTTPTSPGRTQHRCGLCDGRGWIVSDDIPAFGSTEKKWCSGCNQYVYLTHNHKQCPSCKGKGQW